MSVKYLLHTKNSFITQKSFRKTFSEFTECVKIINTKMTVPNIELNNGVKIPAIGLGTWRSPPEVVTQAVKDAIDVGYRHIDCAYIYDNEREVGTAIEDMIKDDVIKREDIFITSKLWNTFHQPDAVRRACEISLRNLRTTYLDCYLMHWPTAFQGSAEHYPKNKNGDVIFDDIDYVVTWQAMEKLVDDGICKSIGISNFNRRQIKRLLQEARIRPALLQIECHPYLNQRHLIDYCQTSNIAVTAYSPLGSKHTPYLKPGEYSLMEDPIIVEIAERYQRNVAQILLRYQLQRGNIVIPRSVNREHMITNLSAYEFEIDPGDMDILNGLDFSGRFLKMEAATGHPHHPFQYDEY